MGTQGDMDTKDDCCFCALSQVEMSLGGMSQPLKEEAMGKSKVQMVIWVPL